MAKSSSGGGLWVVIGILVLVAIVPRDIWIILGIVAGIVIVAYALMKVLGSSNAPNDQEQSEGPKGRYDHEPTLAELMGESTQPRSAANVKRVAEPEAPYAPAIAPRTANPTRSNHSDQFYSAQKASSTAPSPHSLPEPPPGFGDGHWVPPGEQVQVAGIDVPGGMIYIGAQMNGPNGITDPCLISAHLPVARAGDYRTRQMGYWPSYSEASPSERRAYLNWLSGDRSDPDCDIGYVFLFFYGLERRVFVDSRDQEATRDDWPAITEELHRLLAIYGEKSGSFRRYAGELLSWIELDGVSGRLYEKPIPDFPKAYDLPPYLRLALGQASVDRAPLPAALALAWLRLTPDTNLRTAATRCPSEFDQLFIQRYRDTFGPGLLLPKNRTKLKFVYHAASSGLRGISINIGFGDTPDVTALTAPIKKLKELANQCTDELGSYSRLIGKDPSLAGSLESLLLLPAAIWPAEAKTKLEALTGRIHEEYLVLTLRELYASLGGTKQSLKHDRTRGLAQALESVQIGMEPHVIAGARMPGELDNVVLFHQPQPDADTGSGAEYKTAALRLQLASVLAEADGDFSEHEKAHLRAEIDSWSHLSPAERCRLHAHLQWLIVTPQKLTTLKRKLEPLSVESRETVTAFMVALAQSDGFVSPEEVKFLEKIYKALEVDPARVFSDVHSLAASGNTPVTTKQVEKEGFQLDADRIAALQKDTARVSSLLSEIFTEEDPSSEPPPPSEFEEIETSHSPLGLDESHSALVRLLLSRPQWTRAELEDAASDLDLMLDGALEQINEAAFDAFDEPLCEGDEPLEVNVELLERIEA